MKISDHKIDQGSLYNNWYNPHVYDERGLPDLKISDGKILTKKIILSIGGGMGTDVWYLTKENEVHLIDSSTAAVSIAKDHGIKSKKGDVCNRLPYLDESFDIIILKDILEHVIDPLTLLFEAKRILKKNGYVIVSVPNHFYLWFRLRILFGKNLLWKTFQHDHTKNQEEWNYMHVRFFTWTGFQRLISTTNFKIEKEFWDLGELAHYSDPEMFYQVLKDKANKSPQALLFLNIFYPLYRFINFIFPKSFRSKIVSLNPGLLCAGFYLRLRKR